MKRTLLVFLLLTIGAHAPWKLMALFAETLVVSPGFTRTDEGQDKYWQCQELIDKLERFGWDVEFVNGLEAQGIYGLTMVDPVEGVRSIKIEETLSWNARYNVLAHEGGHTLVPTWSISRGQNEVFAESVAALMAHDGLREHARYLAKHRGDIFIMVAFWPEIYRAAATLEN